MGGEAFEVEVTETTVVEGAASETEALMREVRAATRFPDDRMFVVLAKLKQLNQTVYFDALHILGHKFMPRSQPMGSFDDD